MRDWSIRGEIVLSLLTLVVAVVAASDLRTTTKPSIQEEVVEPDVTPDAPHAHTSPAPVRPGTTEADRQHQRDLQAAARR